MLKKYFYVKFIELYLYRVQMEKSRSECFNATDLDADTIAFWERDLSSNANEIRIIKGIASDLIGKHTALEIKEEARTDAKTLIKNAVYWMPDNTADLLEYTSRYKDNEIVTTILKKCIGGMTE